MSDLQRTAQKLEVTFEKTIHIKDYESEKYSCSLTATFNRAMTPEEDVVEIEKLQAELDYAIYSTLYKRKLISTYEYNARIEDVRNHLLELGVSEKDIKYLKGGTQE